MSFRAGSNEKPPPYVRTNNGGFALGSALTAEDGVFDGYEYADEAFLHGRVNRHNYEFDPQIRRLVKEATVRKAVKMFRGRVANAPGWGLRRRLQQYRGSGGSSGAGGGDDLAGAGSDGGGQQSDVDLSVLTGVSARSVAVPSAAALATSSGVSGGGSLPTTRPPPLGTATSSSPSSSSFSSNNMTVAVGTGDMGASAIINNDDDTMKAMEANIPRYCRNGQIAALKRLVAAKGGSVEIFTKHVFPYVCPNPDLKISYEGDNFDVRAMAVSKIEGFYMAHIHEAATPLMWAALAGNFSIVKWFIEMGIDVNIATAFSGRTALHWAVMENHFDVVRLLLENGASLYQKDKQGCDAFIFAILSDHLAMLILLNEVGRMNPLTCDIDGMTYLHFAALKNNLPAMQYLHEVVGIAVDIIDLKDRTPLHIAAMEGAVDCVHYLLMKKCPLRAMDGEGKIAIQHALARRHYSTTRPLRMGANEPLSHVHNSFMFMANNNAGRVLFFIACGFLVAIPAMLLVAGLPPLFVFIFFILLYLCRKGFLHKFGRRPMKTGQMEAQWVHENGLSESFGGFLRGSWLTRRRDPFTPTFWVGLVALEAAAFFMIAAPNAGIAAPPLFIPLGFALFILALLVYRNQFSTIVSGKSSVTDSELIPVMRAAAAQFDVKSCHENVQTEKGIAADGVTEIITAVRRPFVNTPPSTIVPLPSTGGTLPLSSITGRVFDFDRHVRIPLRANYCVEIDRYMRCFEGWSVLLDAPISSANHHWFILFLATLAVHQLSTAFYGYSQLSGGYCASPSIIATNAARPYWSLETAENNGFIAGYVGNTVVSILTWILNHLIYLMPCRDVIVDPSTLFGTYRTSMMSAASLFMWLVPFVFGLFPLGALVYTHLFRVVRAVTGPELEYPFVIATGNGDGGHHCSSAVVEMSTAAASPSAVAANSCVSGRIYSIYRANGGAASHHQKQQQQRFMCGGAIGKKIANHFRRVLSILGASESQKTDALSSAAEGFETIYGTGSAMKNIFKMIFQCGKLYSHNGRLYNAYSYEAPPTSSTSPISVTMHGGSGSGGSSGLAAVERIVVVVADDCGCDGGESSKLV